MLNKFNALYKLIMEQAYDFNDQLNNIPVNINTSEFSADLIFPWESYNRDSLHNSIQTLYTFPFYYKEEINSSSTKYKSLASILLYWFNDIWYNDTLAGLIKYINAGNKDVSTFFDNHRREAEAAKLDFDLIVNKGTTDFKYVTDDNRITYTWNRIKFNNIDLVQFIYELVNSYNYEGNLTAIVNRLNSQQIN